MLNFVIAHVLNTFELVTEQIVDVGKEKRTFDIERPLPINAAPDARAQTFRLTLYSRPSLMKMWQAKLSEDEARRALVRSAHEAQLPLQREAVETVYLSFQQFVAHRGADLHRRNMETRLRNVTMTNAGVAQSASAAGTGAVAVGVPVPLSTVQTGAGVGVLFGSGTTSPSSGGSMSLPGTADRDNEI